MALGKFALLLLSPFLLAWSDPAIDTPAADPALQGQIHRFFRIQVLDRDTRQPIQGAQLRTTNKIVLTTDRNGFIAFYEPGLMNTKVYFGVSHPGWEMPKDGFGNSGVILDIREGAAAEILLTRTSGQTIDSGDDRATRSFGSGKTPTVQLTRLAISIIQAQWGSFPGRAISRRIWASIASTSSIRTVFPGR